MSDPLGRFVSLVGADVAEGAARAYMTPGGQPSAGSQPTAGMPKRPRQPRATSSIPSTPFFAKQELAVATHDHKAVQARLDAVLAKFVDEQPTQERKAAMLIKVGVYQAELDRHAEALAKVDPIVAAQSLQTWFAEGDGPLKKAMVNATSGVEEFPLVKMVIKGPEDELAAMIDAQPNHDVRMGMLQKVGIYTRQASDLITHGMLLKASAEDVNTRLDSWINEGDGSHKELKKAVSAAMLARQQANAQVGENEAVKEKIGNAPTHVGAQFTSEHDRRYVPRSTAEGAGKHVVGNYEVPNQENGETVNVSSGPDDTGGGAITPSLKIRRKGATGGLGSVAGAEGSSHVEVKTDDDDIDPKTGKARRKTVPNVNKAEPTEADLKKWTDDVGVELAKMAPDAVILQVGSMPEAEQRAYFELAGVHAADLMTWSDQQDPDKMQKAALDASITEWLRADPEQLPMKQWVAEALATAEDIPLELGKAIMAWKPPAATQRVRARAA